MHINLMCILLLFSPFITATSNVFQPSLDPGTIQISTSIKGKHILQPVIKTNIYHENKTKEVFITEDYNINTKGENVPMEFREEMENRFSDENGHGKNFAEKFSEGMDYRSFDENKQVVCMEPFGVTGWCRAGFQRWSYDQKDGKCKDFTWGGCPVNRNIFHSHEICKQTCITVVCLEPFGVQGDCQATIQRWSYDQKDGKCKKFIYGGCGGNENNFGGPKKCKHFCKPVVCLKPFGDAGYCHANIQRWSYDQKDGTCKKFIYGGCGGNENNFDGPKKCKNVCKTANGRNCSVQSIANDCRCPKKKKPVCAGGKTYFNLCAYKCAKKTTICNGSRVFPSVTKYDAC